MATEQQIPQLAGELVKHQRHFNSLSVEDAQWAIQNTVTAIDLFVSAVKNRNHQSQTSNEVVDQMIYVDRSIRPAYPDWVQEVLYPELEATGPSEFDAGKLEQWLHGDQKHGVVVGNVIHEYHKEHDMLKDDLGLRDLEEIQKKGIDFFRKYFQGKAVFGWKSVVRVRGGRLGVPCLYEGSGRVCLCWRWLGYAWGDYYPALRFAS